MKLFKYTYKERLLKSSVQSSTGIRKMTCGNGVRALAICREFTMEARVTCGFSTLLEE